MASVLLGLSWVSILRISTIAYRTGRLLALVAERVGFHNELE